MRVLGIWDGHDSGACVAEDGRVVVAVNEERLTRRKLEIRFPAQSIAACLRHCCIQPAEIDAVAYSTSDAAKTLARMVPYTKETYYQIRRRKLGPSRTSFAKKRFKYWLTTKGSNGLTSMLSRRAIASELHRLGFETPNLVQVDHHQAHAASAAFCCGFPNATVVTCDGVGDGLSLTVSRLEGGVLTRIDETPAEDSLGVFFEHVTNLLNMRELEDEGKVMALATYAYPIPDEQNPLIEFFSIDGTRVRAKYGPLRMYDELKRALWYFPSEQFAYMAQRALEIHIAELVRNAVKKTGFGDLALAGGVASNIKVNMLLRDLPEVGEVFVFPHMGDGGLAVGAALQAAADADAKPNGRLDDIFWGPDCPIGDTAVPAEVTTHAFSETGEVVDFTAARLAEGEIVLWYQGRMEYGPRALGNRSILARPDLPEMRDRLNLQLKKRVWYQPFCPSMLDSEAGWLLENADGLPNRFMTSGYRVRPSVKNFLQGVLGVDGSCRPQFVAADASPYASLLDAMRQRMGTGCVLNTSMNVHGEPLVWTLDQAFKLMVDSRFHYLICPCEKKVFELKGSGSG